MRFLAPPPFEFKFLGDHLKNYFTMSGLCLLAVWLGEKGANYDRTAPFLGKTMAFLIAIAAFLFGCVNLVQLMLSVQNHGIKGKLWKVGAAIAFVFLCFFFTAVYQHGMDAVSSIASHGATPNR